MNDVLLKILVCLAALGITALLMRIINRRKTRRALQRPFPFIAAVILAAEIVLLTLYRADVLAFINRFPALSNAMAQITTAGGPLYGTEILMWNVLVIWVYLLLKMLLLFPVTAICRRSGMNAVLKKYETGSPAKDPEIFLLRNSAVNQRTVMLIVTVILGLSAAAFCLTTYIAGPGSDLWLLLYPAAAWVIVSEEYRFLSGLTRKEYEDRFGGEDQESEQFSNYSTLKQVFEEQFPEALLTSRSGKFYDDKTSSGDILHQMLNSDDKTEQLVAGYFLHLPGRREGTFDVDMVKACASLMRGESTIIYDPFYRDLDDYLTLPLMDTLLSGKKILVICGRQGIVPDINEWVTELMRGYCRTDRLWRTGVLDGKKEYDIGILSFSNLYDVGVINSSKLFFEQVGFILLVEPTRMLTTAQAGLGIVVGKLNPSKIPVFCAVDKEADGLVDLLSHLFLQNVTNVVAAPSIKALYTYMNWDAAGEYHRQSLFQNETRYLGNGVELAATALRYQVPEVSWYSEGKAPVRDLRWLAQQYYQPISQYANIPNRQAALDEMIRFVSNPLDSMVTDDAFIIAEDECCNLFATVRAYLTRATGNLFVNVMSENYLLRDYMRFNWRLFMSDAKAIPLIAPHYAKTERNTVLRLVVMMSGEAIKEDYVRHELQLLGYSDSNIYDRLQMLVVKYLGITHSVISVSNRREYSVDDIPIPVMYYHIPLKRFEAEFATTLKTGFFVVEDEELETELIDARMFTHITQMVMPGQQIIHSGKVYKVQRISPDVGCVLHRAADLYMSRLYYRQIRTYALKEKSVRDIVSRKSVGNMEITVENMDFSVSSTGYVEMKDAYDLTTARVIDLSDDPSVKSGDGSGTDNLYNRKYSTKPVMKLKFRDMDEKTRYTLCLILEQIFVTIFPYSWHYIAVLCKKTVSEDNLLYHMTYNLDPKGLDEDAIYILEDSIMDLGLLEAVDNNLTRLLEIAADYLNWYAEMDWRAEEAQAADAEQAKEQGDGKKKQKQDAKEKGADDGEKEKQETVFRPTYDRTCFMKFGRGEIDPAIDLKAAAGYLNEHGYGDNSLSKARKPEKMNLPRLEKGLVCDFCGRQLTGVSYDRLEDGRNRCGRCSATAVNDQKTFESLFRDAKSIMEQNFHITFSDAIIVRMVDAPTISKKSSRKRRDGFKPTPGFDVRAVGLAVQNGDSYEIYIENGSPRVSTLATMVHELTHIWQYQNWKPKEIAKRYKKDRREYVYEGMAMWAELQILYVLGEYSNARDLEQGAEGLDRVYSEGLKKYIDEYGLDRGGNVGPKTPFNTFPPL